MENRINQVMTLEDGRKYVILHQAIYNNDNYYVCSGVTDDENDVTEEFQLLHEMKNGEDISVELVSDPTLAKFILEHLNLID